MAPFDTVTSYQSAIVSRLWPYHVSRVSLSRYLMLKNVFTMKSRLGVTHPANLCTTAKIYRPSVIFLLVTAWSIYTYTQRAAKEAGWGCALGSFEVIQGHWNWYQLGKPICTSWGSPYAIYCYSPLLWRYALIVFEIQICTFAIFTHHSLVWSHRKGVSPGI